MIDQNLSLDRKVENTFNFSIDHRFFSQLNYSQLYFTIKLYQSENCDRFYMNWNYPLQKIDRKNMNYRQKYLNWNQAERLIPNKVFLAIYLIFAIEFPIWHPLDEKIDKYGDRSIFVDRSKSWKHFQLSDRSPVCQPIEFL